MKISKISEFSEIQPIYCSMSIQKIISINRKNNGLKVYKYPINRQIQPFILTS